MARERRQAGGQGVSEKRRNGKPSRPALLLGSLAAGLMALAAVAGIIFPRHRTGRHTQPRPPAQAVVAGAAQANGRAAADHTDPHEQLRQRVSLSLQAVPLPKALTQLAEKLRTNIVLDERTIREAGIPIDAPVTIHVEVPDSASAILKLMLQPRELGYVVEGRSIKVTTWEVVESTWYVRVYSVADLLTAAGDEQTPSGKDRGGEPKRDQPPPKPRHDFRSLISLLTMVAPPSWDYVGGPGKIEAFAARASLVITQTQPTHEAIADLHL